MEVGESSSIYAYLWSPCSRIHFAYIDYAGWKRTTNPLFGLSDKPSCRMVLYMRRAMDVES